MLALVMYKERDDIVHRAVLHRAKQYFTILTTNDFLKTAKSSFKLANNKCANHVDHYKKHLAANRILQQANSALPALLWASLDHSGRQQSETIDHIQTGAIFL